MMPATNTQVAGRRANAPGRGTGGISSHANETLQEPDVSAGEAPVNGHPGIFKRGNRYTARVKDGRGKTRRVNGRTIAEVDAKRSALRTDLLRGEFQPASAERFDSYARAWIETYPGRTARGFRDETRREYRVMLERHAVPYFRSERLSNIDAAAIRSFIAHVSPGRRPNTIRLALAPLRCLLADAAEQGVIRFNPARGVRVGSLARDVDEPVRALDDQQRTAFMATVPEKYQLFTRFAFETGLRISELVELRYRDVDFAAGRVHVKRRYREGRVAKPKSRSGVRSIPLTPEMTRLLWQHRKEALDASDGALVWPAAAGGHLDATSVARWCKKAADRAGVICTPHVWRHTCVTNLLRAGLSVKQAQVWAGHSSPTITLGIYADAMAGEVAESPFATEGGNQVGTRAAETSRNRAEREPAESGNLRAVSS
jgi:integrase